MDVAETVILKALERQKGTKHVIERGDSAVQQFYSGATVFVTGGSGFLGKQLIEKLFRSCKLRRVYMLMRAKKGKSVAERLAEILKDPYPGHEDLMKIFGDTQWNSSTNNSRALAIAPILYDTLREELSDFVHRIVPIVGELAEVDLAISKEDRKVLIEEVDVIFHVAATISFEEPLRSATLINVRGTRDLIKLGRQCRKLRSFVYISTTYSHATFSRRDTEVKEQFYPSPIPPDVMIRLVETMDEDRLNGIKDGLIKDWPNTYAFTKALAEELVRSNEGQLPLCMVRPSIVICAKREPYAGWIDLSSVYGPSGITLGCMLGVIHALQSVQDIRIDFIPVDYVNNTAIVAATKASKQLKIYNVASSNRKHLTWGGLTHILNNVARRTVISPQALWYCFAVQTPYLWLHIIFRFLLHTVPSNLADGLCRLVKKPPRLKKTYAKINKMSSTIAFYTNNNWIFTDNNTEELYNNLSFTDKIIYHCDVTDIEWTDLIVLWCVGLRKYIVKDGIKNTKLGMQKQFYLRIATYVLCCSFVNLLLLFFYYLFF